MADLIHVKGLADLQKHLETLPARMERNVLRGGLRAGANVVLPVARGNIHSVSGETAASLKVGTRAGGGEVKAYVRCKSHKARWLEYGTRPHVITPKRRKAMVVGGAFAESVDHPGARPHPFMRPALDATASAAVIAVGNYIKNRLATKNGLDTADIVIEEDGE